MQNDVDAILVLPAGIKQDSSGRWVSTDLTPEDDAHGAPGGKLRIHAASILAALHPRAVIITGGGKGFDVDARISNERPLLAEILRDELLEVGIPLERMQLDWNSQTTYQGLQELDNIIQKSIMRRIVVVTNRYHLGRVHAMIETKFSHILPRVMLEFVGAEDVLVVHNEARWRSHIEKAYLSEFMKKRIAMEEEGATQIRLGTYRFR